ncbi:MAG: peptidoglycan-binding domain-containing protein [Hyphomicrobiales bacterium]
MKKGTARSVITLSIFCFIFAMVAASNSLAAGTSKMPAEKSTMTSTKAMKAAPNDQTMAIQKALNKEGYNLKEDGLMGKHTRAAIESFQKKNGLQSTGKPDSATLAKLGMK